MGMTIGLRFAVMVKWILISIVLILSSILVHDTTNTGVVLIVDAYTCPCASINNADDSCFNYAVYAPPYNCQKRDCGAELVCDVGGPYNCESVYNPSAVVYKRSTILEAGNAVGCTKNFEPRTTLRIEVPAAEDVIFNYYLFFGYYCSQVCQYIGGPGYTCSESSALQMKTSPINLKIPFVSPFDTKGTPVPTNKFQCNFPYITPFYILSYTSIQTDTNTLCAMAYAPGIPPNYYYQLYITSYVDELCVRYATPNKRLFCPCRFTARRRSLLDSAYVHQTVLDTVTRDTAVSFESLIGKLMAGKGRVSRVNETTSKASIKVKRTEQRTASSVAPTRRVDPKYSGVCESVKTPGGRHTQTCCQVAGEHDNWVCFPAMILLGAQKAGTTALFAHLLEHPEFHAADLVTASVGSNVLNKEVHFFDTDFQWNEGPHHYLRHYQVLPKEQRSSYVNGDLSPSYMVKWSTLKSIQELSPQARLVIMLRDPLKRAWSEIKMKIRQDLAIFEWKELVARFSPILRDCIQKQENIRGVQKFKKLVDSCVPASLSQHERWPRLLQSTIHQAIVDAGTTVVDNKKITINRERVVENLFHASKNGSLVIRGFGEHSHGVRKKNYETEFVEEAIVYNKITEEIEQIQKCLDQGDETLKTCFETGGPWVASDISRAHVLRGMYYAQIANVYELFPKDQVLVIETEELRSDAVRVMKQVCKHVGLNDFRFELADSATLSQRIEKHMPGFADLSGWRMNSEEQQMEDEMPENLKSILSNFYSVHNEKLFALLGKRFDHWSR